MEMSSSREKILQAVIDIIGKEKQVRPTVREIATRADVNTAAINYYFRTKENLFAEAENALAKMLTANYAILDDHTVSPIKRLYHWADSMMKFIMEYPGILLVLGIKVFEDGSRDLKILIMAAEEKLISVIEEADPSAKEETSFKLQQLMACVIYPVLVQSGIGNDKTMDLQNPAQRQAYLASVFSSILPECM
jgi:AcrR family transcriptional regulator